MNDNINKIKAEVILLVMFKFLYLNENIDNVSKQIRPVATMYSPILKPLTYIPEKDLSKIKTK